MLFGVWTTADEIYSGTRINFDELDNSVGLKDP
jgi:hypothetical protein